MNVMFFLSVQAMNILEKIYVYVYIYIYIYILNGFSKDIQCHVWP